MVPVFRCAKSNHILQAAATRDGANVPQPEPMSAAKLACILLSLLLLNAFGLWTIRVSEHLSLSGATSMIFLTFFFATWNETRVWSEWSVLFAILAAVQLERSFASPSPLAGRPLPERHTLP